jgi:hypothetical protein
LRLSILVRPARRLALATAALVGALGASSGAAAAQTITATYAPACGPGTPCTLVQFDITNGTGSQLDLATLTFISAGSPFLFAPVGGGSTLYQAVDSFGGFGGIGAVSSGGTQVFINFLDTSLPFTLLDGGSGFVALELEGTPDLAGSSFRFSGELAGGGTVQGRVLATSTVPEPATIVLMGSGLAALASGTVLSRRRRQG